MRLRPRNIPVDAVMSFSTALPCRISLSRVDYYEDT